MDTTLEWKGFALHIEALREAFAAERVKGLLAEYSRRLSCRGVAVLGQDVYAFPPLSRGDGVEGLPGDCHKLSTPSGLGRVAHYFDTARQKYLLRVDVVHGGFQLGTITLFRSGEDFSAAEDILLEYGGTLCSGLEQRYLRSAGIHEALCGAYEGRGPGEKCLAGLPAEGCAMVLRLDDPIPGRAPAGDDRFLGYLTHLEFAHRLFFTFADADGLLLAFAGESAEVLAGELVELMEKNGRRYTAGVSGRHPREALTEALAEARHAANIGSLLGERKRVYVYGNLGIYRLFSYPDNGWPINQMLADMTRELNRFDLEKKTVLANTIAAFVENNFSYTKTADQMYTHPNTIRYRVRILEELWRYDLTRDEDKLLFRILGKLLPLWMRYMEQLGVDIDSYSPPQEIPGKF